jgi:uncharacterized membrane protein
VFDQINGLPVHVLVVHAAVVFIPLLALAAVVYALVPPLRQRIGWATVLLAIVGPACAFVAKQSGQTLDNHLVASGAGKQLLAQITVHSGLGTRTFWFTLALGVVTLLMTVLTLPRRARLPRPADLGLAVVLIALAAVSGYYVYKTGDSGAHMVWGSTG